MGAAPRCGQAPALGQPVPGGLAVLLARAPLTCPGAPPPPLQSPARAHPPPVYLPRGCLAHPARPRWMRVVLRHPLAGHWVVGIYTLLPQGPRGQKGASHRRPLLASGVSLGLGSRPLPGPLPRGVGGMLSIWPRKQPGPWHPRSTALRPERWPAALGACTHLLRAEGPVSPAEGVQQGPCPPCSSPAIFRCLARRLPEVKGPREVSAGRRGEEPCLPSATSFLS